MRLTVEETTVAALIKALLADAGYRLVRVRIATNGEGRTVQVMAEPTDGRTMLVDDCATLDAMIDPVLEAAAVFQGAFRLEVSSPGIDRPLMEADDFKRYTGFEAKVELAEPMDGRKRFRGRLQGMKIVPEGEAVELVVDNKPVQLPLAAIAQAQLVLTDDLIRAHQKQQNR